MPRVRVVWMVARRITLAGRCAAAKRRFGVALWSCSGSCCRGLACQPILFMLCACCAHVTARPRSLAEGREWRRLLAGHCTRFPVCLTSLDAALTENISSAM